MAKTYTFHATAIIKVEADTAIEARGFAEEVAAELKATLPTGVTLANVDGRVYVATV